MRQDTATHAPRFGASSHGHGGAPERRISAESDTSSFGFSPRKAGGFHKNSSRFVHPPLENRYLDDDDNPPGHSGGW